MEIPALDAVYEELLSAAHEGAKKARVLITTPDGEEKAAALLDASANALKVCCDVPHMYNWKVEQQARRG